MEQMKNIDVDKIDDLRDKMDDMAYEQQEMNEMLNFNSFTNNVDESDLDAELNALGMEMQMGNINPNVNTNPANNYQQPNLQSQVNQNIQ